MLPPPANTYQKVQCNEHIDTLNHTLYLEFTSDLHRMPSLEIIGTDEQTHHTFWAQVQFLFLFFSLQLLHFEILQGQM